MEEAGAFGEFGGAAGGGFWLAQPPNPATTQTKKRARGLLRSP
jgi:hypothetical protein